MSLHKLQSSILTLSLLLAPAASAAEYGTADEARAMLDRVIAEVKADPTKALAKFNAGEDGFVDRDLYPFCIGPDRTISGHPDPATLGKKSNEIKDVDGKMVTDEMLGMASEEGKVMELAYKWPRLGSTESLPKVSFFTKIGEQVCGVGYYK